MPYCLAKDEVCFVGEPVAIVVADSRYLAEDAAALVDIDFDRCQQSPTARRGLSPARRWRIVARRTISEPSFGSMSAMRMPPSRRPRTCSASGSFSIAAGRFSWNAAA